MLLVVMCKMVVLGGWCGKKLVVLCGCDVEVGQQTGINKNVTDTRGVTTDL